MGIKIISGGQTGADRAGLDVAIDLGISYSGSIVKGRKAEDGQLDPLKYKNIVELKSTSYLVRTEKNVKDADLTLIFSHGELEGGSKRTKDYAIKHKKRYIHIDFLKEIDESVFDEIRNNIIKSEIKINIAGARASKDPKIYNKVYEFLTKLFKTD
ncbi:MAG: putative molybdenum carrier protein [Desulfobacterales bacterium]|nr:putative molybdenum carrier protein [Desulfobacterales bacterium]